MNEDAKGSGAACPARRPTGPALDLVRVLGLLLLSSIACLRADPGETALPRHQVRLEPPPLVRLAAHLARADEYARREFALLSLQAIRGNYLDELRSAAREQPASARHRAKLARWRAATRDLVRQLDRLIEQLNGGPEVGIQVDRTRQIILFIDRTPVLLSTPTAKADRDISHWILESFCAFNDCSFLQAEGRPGRAARRLAGNWLLRQDAVPVFEVDSRGGGQVNCEFTSLDGRRDKAALCRRVTDEVDQLAADLAAARALGHQIDWSQLARQPPQPADEFSLVLNAGGAYLRLPLPLISALAAPDWQRLVDWLGNRAKGNTGDLRLGAMHRLQ